jgi:anti-sigma regulatory factor (Ser/Thr protein kinase)
MATSKKAETATTEPAQEQETKAVTESAQDQQATVNAATQTESVYAVSELAANAKIFGERPECVTAALRFAGKATCTVSEAKKIVEEFMKREVK